MTKIPLYRQALRESWQLAWHNKLLWIFGFFAAFLGQMGLLDISIKLGMASVGSAFFPVWKSLSSLCKLPTYLLKHPFILTVDGWLWLVWLLIVFLGFLAFLVFVAVASQGAIIHSSASYANKKKLPAVDASWQAGVRHFWRLFFLNLIKKLVFFALAIVVSYALLNALVYVRGADMALFIVLFILTLAVGVILSFLVIYAAGYVVVEEYSLGRSITAAWRLFAEHWLVSIEVGLVILFLNIVLGMVALASFFLLFMPTLFLWMIAVSIFNSTLYFIAMAVGLSLFALFIVFIGSVYSIFVVSAWTYLFTKMHNKGVTSRILYWAGLAGRR